MMTVKPTGVDRAKCTTPTEAASAGTLSGMKYHFSPLAVPGL